MGSSVPYLKSKKELFEKLKGHPISDVREWAVKESEALSVSLKREQFRDEEWGG